MKYLLLGFITLMLGCVPTIVTNYKGSDYGTIIIGLGEKTKSSCTNCTLWFRKIENGSPVNNHTGYLSFDHNNMWSKQKLDYDSENDHGVVLTATLPPGNYEIFSYNIYIGGYPDTTTVTPRRPISIPFTVTSGQFSYLGSYQLNPISRTTPDSIFSVYNRYAEDLEVAKKQLSVQIENFNNLTPIAYRNQSFPRQ